MDINLDFTLHSRQWDVWEDPARFRVVVAGRRWGKTFLSINELFQAAIKNPKVLCWYVSPTYRQSKEIAWRLLKETIDRRLVKKTNESELSLELKNGSLIELKGCDNADSLRGVGVKFLVVDEYGVMDDGQALWGEVFRPMLLDTKGRALFIGTPKGLNHFYDIYNKGVEEVDGFKSFRFTSYDNPYLDKAEIDAMRDELPPRMFEQEVNTSFLVSDENILITLEDLEATKGVIFHEDKRVKVLSCDGALGNDATAVYILENTSILDHKNFYYTDPMKTAAALAELSARYNVDGITIEGDAIGKGIISHLRHMTDIKIIAPIPGESASESNKFANKRTELWFALWERLKARRIEYISDLELKRQLTAVEYKYVGGKGKVGLVDKRLTKKKLGRSPDDADAYVLGVWAIEQLSLTRPANWVGKQRRQQFMKKKDGYGWSGKGAFQGQLVGY